MKLEERMYVRTKGGYIAKCTYIDTELENIYGFDGAIRKSFGDEYDFIYCKEQEEHIIKASHNIIDLIEEGDILDYEFGGIISKSEVIKEDNELGIGWDDDGDFINLESLYINSIVTKEQFSQMEYKVGE